ncbi:MAG: shikimate dehydrogenase [Ruminococcus flavefaciens]|nr:shikimate dehydrogenase [Ruminococcus flavefaciens]MCM1231220.1 shikimate dehydrogenase [Ruminococcus flavefaciens]
MNKYGLIGHPLGHSMSPLIHERLFALSGITDYSYELIDIAPENLMAEEALLKELKGFNITIPHKMAVIPMTDKLDDSALRYNSVNCISNKDGITTGYNTDCIGFVKSAENENLPLGKKVLLLGCGGVGRMIAVELIRHGADLTVAVIPQDVKTAESAVAEILGIYENAKVKICLISEIEGEYDLLVNATPVGMYPKCDACAVTDEVIAKCGSVFDVIYNPVETLLMKKARDMGKKAVGGAAMLVYQAVAAHEIWYDGRFDSADVAEIIGAVEDEVNKMNK